LIKAEAIAEKKPSEKIDGKESTLRQPRKAKQGTGWMQGEFRDLLSWREEKNLKNTEEEKKEKKEERYRGNTGEPGNHVKLESGG